MGEAADLDLTTPVVERLIANAAVAAYISTYTPDVGAATPAIFSTDIIPGDADYPLIHTAGEVDDTPANIKNTRFRTVVRDIGLYNLSEDGDTAALDVVADKIRNLFDRATMADEHPVDGVMTVAGFKIITIEASKTVAPTDEELMGRIISIKLVLQDLSA